MVFVLPQFQHAKKKSLAKGLRDALFAGVPFCENQDPPLDNSTPPSNHQSRWAESVDWSNPRTRGYRGPAGTDIPGASKMKNIWKAGMCQRYWKPLLAFSLGVVFCVSAMPAAAQQNQQGDIQNGAPPPDSQDQPQGQPQSTYGSGPMQQHPPYAQQQGPQAQDQTNQPVPPQ